jgi:hypothetical protein
MTDAERARLLWDGLTECAAINRDLCIGTVSAFLEFNGADVPDVPLFPEKVRQDALFWASCAAPHELEAYAVASLDALENSIVAHKQTKRLAAAAFRRMAPDDRTKFLRWAENER